jgi:hypothetical protein
MLRSPFSQMHEYSRLARLGIWLTMLHPLQGQERHRPRPLPTILQEIAAAALTREARTRKRIWTIVILVQMN